VSVSVFDPLEASGAAGDSDLATRYLRLVARAGVGAMVSNVRTRWLGLRSGGRVFPLTVNDGEVGDSYVCLPHTAYALYARRELELEELGPLKWLLRPLLALGGRLLLALGINRIVHIDNWLLSTNLHGDWAGEDIAAIRGSLAARFPSHILAIRSLDAWSCPRLLDAVRADGWVCVPSRQIWVTRDLQRQWKPRHAVREDARMLRKLKYRVEDLEQVSAEDAARIALLYRMLYVDKYSGLNPVFTPAFIAATQSEGILRYRVARDAQGRICAVAGSFVRGDVLTPPVVGYDTSAPQAAALYRVATLLFSQAAANAGLRLNGSAGAAHFKRLRGAQGEIEYTAMSIRHLPPARRAMVRALAGVLNGVVVPVMKRLAL
jgi:hypothetical protein